MSSRKKLLRPIQHKRVSLDELSNISTHDWACKYRPEIQTKPVAIHY